jgi:hypothetical protein
VDTEFSADLWDWRGPAPFLWLTVPDGPCADRRDRAAEASYGWGVIPVRARIGATVWATSLFPRDGYLLPVKADVRRWEGVDPGDTFTASIRAAPRGGREANGSGPKCRSRR